MKNIIFKIIIIILLVATTILSITNTIRLNTKSNKLENSINNSNIQLRDDTDDKIEKNIKTLNDLNKKIEEQEKTIVELQNTINKQQEEITNLQNQINGINSSNYQGQINNIDNRVAQVEDFTNYYKKTVSKFAYNNPYTLNICINQYIHNRNNMPEHCK